MATIIQSVISVSDRETRKGPIYEVGLADGTTVTTFDKPLADKAKAAYEAGTPVRVGFTTKVNGQYTNHYLDSLDSADGAEIVQSPLGTASSGSVGTDPTASRIARTSAWRGALDASLARGGPIVWEEVDEALEWILNAVKPDGQ